MDLSNYDGRPEYRYACDKNSNGDGHASYYNEDRQTPYFDTSQRDNMMEGQISNNNSRNRNYEGRDEEDGGTLDCGSNETSSARGRSKGSKKADESNRDRYYDRNDRSRHRSRGSSRSRSRSPGSTRNYTSSRDGDSTENRYRRADDGGRSRARRSPSPSDRRDRSRSGSPSRQRYSHSGTRSRSRSRSFDRDRDYEFGRSYARRDKEVTPNNTIVLKGLPSFCDDTLVHHVMGRQGFLPKHVRVVKSKETGQSRGFGFVEFVDVNEAIRWMLYTQGRLQLDDQCVVDMQYSVNKPLPQSHHGPGFSSHQRTGDWTCAKCNTNNFKKRDTCFKCNLRYNESEALSGEGFNEIGVMPCDTLLLRNVPLSVDEQCILAAISKLSSLDIRRILVARNPDNKMSRGFAYVEMTSITAAAQLLTTLTAVTKLNLDGREILVSYSKYPLQGVLNGANLVEDTRPQLPLSSSINYTSASRMPTDVTNAAAAVAQNAIKKAQVLRQVAASHISSTTGSLASTVAAATMPATTLIGTHPILVVNPAATAAAALLIQQQQQTVLATQALREMAAARLAQESIAATVRVSLGTVQTPFGELPRYPVPDVSAYTYDQATGFYYDLTTGLYYDGKTQYYYNSETQQYLYWDGSYQTYLPAPTQSDQKVEKNQEKTASESTPVSSDTNNNDAKKPGQEKEDKAKIAKKIQKDMEKWAKQNQKKTKATTGPPSAQPTSATTMTEADPQESRSSKAADAAFSVLAKTSGLVSYDAGDSDEEVNSVAPSALKGFSMPSSSNVVNEPDVDFEKLTCRLCRRQFPSREVLMKHVQFSDLHKKNLEAKARSNVTADQLMASVDCGGGGVGSQYRDRAKERRLKFGDDDRPLKNKLKEKYLQALDSTATEQPTADGIKGDNVGSKLLKSMGWQEGQGLGRQNQGIVDPITAKRRSQGVGLGAGGVVNDSSSFATSYKEQVMATMRQKYYDVPHSPNDQ